MSKLPGGPAAGFALTEPLNYGGLIEKMTVKGPKGQSQLVTISLDTITVNETFPAALFRTPSPGSPAL